MKKFFLTFFILLILFLQANISLSQEKYDINLTQNDNYLILLNEPIAELLANDAESMKFEILTTLYNEKNQIMLTPLKEGTFRLYIILENNKYIVLTINSSVNNENKLKISNSKLIKTILKLDKVENKPKEITKKLQIELDEPPLLLPKLRGAH